jgi:hypothetical protein
MSNYLGQGYKGKKNKHGDFGRNQFITGPKTHEIFYALSFVMNSWNSNYHFFFS